MKRERKDERADLSLSPPPPSPFSSSFHSMVTSIASLRQPWAENELAVLRSHRCVGRGAGWRDGAQRYFQTPLLLSRLIILPLSSLFFYLSLSL